MLSTDVMKVLKYRLKLWLIL